MPDPPDVPEHLRNREVELRELDLPALEGLSIPEIRARVDRDDCALLVDVEPLPPSVPVLALEWTPREGEGDPCLIWRCMTDDGSWRIWRREPVEFADSEEARRAVPSAARIYTTRTRATPGYRMRPIATLTLDERGTCTEASAWLSQAELLDMEARERLVRARRTDVPKRRVPASCAEADRAVKSKSIGIFMGFLLMVPIFARDGLGLCRDGLGLYAS